MNAASETRSIASSTGGYLVNDGRLTYPHPLNWKELAFQKAIKWARSPASVCVAGPSNHSTYMPILFILFLKQRTLHPGASKLWSTPMELDLFTNSKRYRVIHTTPRGAHKDKEIGLHLDAANNGFKHKKS